MELLFRLGATWWIVPFWRIREPGAVVDLQIRQDLTDDEQTRRAACRFLPDKRQFVADSVVR